MNKIPLIILTGPTAVGKTDLSIKLAKSLDAEIISADSMQIYKYMDIGSAKPDKTQLARVRHHMVDVADPREDFSVARYQEMAEDAIRQILGKGLLPVVAGGTGLYMNSLIYDMDFAQAPAQEGYRKKLHEIAEEKGSMALYEMLKGSDPEAAERIHPNNVKKVIRALEACEHSDKGVQDISALKKKRDDWDVILMGLCMPREILYERINKRVDILVSQGLEKEIRDLLAMGLDEDNISMKGIGYKEMIGHINGQYDLEEAVRLIKRNTRHYAKRQMTWFRRYEDLKWFDLTLYDNEDEALDDMISWITGEING